MSYTIQSGDTLWKIATEQCGATGNDIQKTINEIAQLNNIENPNLIFTGKNLKLPGDTFQPSGGAQPAQENTQKAASGVAPTDNEEGTQGNDFKENNNKIFEEFEKWRKAYADAMEAYEKDGNQEALDEALSSIGGKSFDFNKDDNYQENLKSIANGMFKSLSNENGITYDAFLNWYSQGITSSEQQVLSENQDRFREAFDKLDANGNSVLDSDEVEDMFEAFDKMDKLKAFDPRAIVVSGGGEPVYYNDGKYKFNNVIHKLREMFPKDLRLNVNKEIGINGTSFGIFSKVIDMFKIKPLIFVTIK